jgi:hypothetical protein
MEVGASAAAVALVVSRPMVPVIGVRGAFFTPSISERSPAALRFSPGEKQPCHPV